MRNLGQTQPLVDAWFDFLPPGQRPIARILQQTVRGALPALTEQVRWGNLVFLIDSVPLVGLASHKNYMALQILLNVPLGQRFPQIESYGKGQKLLKNKPGVAVDEDLVAAIVRTLAGQARRGDPRGGRRRP
jgi:hypothetical protein